MKMLPMVVLLCGALAHAQESASNPSPTSGKEMFIPYWPPVMALAARETVPLLPCSGGDLRT